MSIKDGKLFYHLTSIDSFESIVKNGLMSRDELSRNNLSFTDTADHDILQERNRLGLSQYILFHFHIHTAYDTAVKNNNTGKEFIYLCIHRDIAKENNFLILPIHPASTEQPNLLGYDEGLKQIDWDVMEISISEAKTAGVDLRYHKQVRMAECLSPLTIPIEYFQSINVLDENCKKYVEDILKKYNITNKPPYINVQKWFVDKG